MITRDDIQASEAEWERARANTDRFASLCLIAGVVFVSLLAVPAAFAASLVTSGVAEHFLTAIFLGALITPIFVMILASARKLTRRADQAMTLLERQLKEAVTRVRTAATASGVELPDKFYMSFDKYETETPKAEAAAPLLTDRVAPGRQQPCSLGADGGVVTDRGPSQLRGRLT